MSGAGWGYWGWGLWFWLFWALIVLWLMFVIQWGWGRGRWRRTVLPEEQILRERFDRGEITREEYDRRMRDLNHRAA